MKAGSPSQELCGLGDVKGLNWNEIIRSPCQVLSLNKAILRVIRNRVPKGRLWLELEISLGLITGVFSPTTRIREHIECGVVVERKLIGGSIRWLVVMLSMCMWKLNEHSISGGDHS